MTWVETFQPGAFGPPDGSIEIRNLRGVVSGRLRERALELEILRAENGMVVSLGGTPAPADVVVDANGAVAVPGLIDTHLHVVFGDWTPRQDTIGFIESYMHGGVTQAMSASEVHLPGRPSDREGVKALAVAAQRAFTAFRPGGVKVHAGSVICEPVLQDTDFAWLASQGVRLMKVGFGAFADPADAAPQVAWARANGFIVMSHWRCFDPWLEADNRGSPPRDVAGHRRARERRDLEPPRRGHRPARPQLLDSAPDRAGGEPALGARRPPCRAGS